MTTIAMPLPGRMSRVNSGGVEYKVKKTEFGNSYSQRAPDGINNKRSTWNIEWHSLTQSERDTVVNALDSTSGVDTISWTPPGEASDLYFVIEGYSVSAYNDMYFSVNIAVKQVF